MKYIYSLLFIIFLLYTNSFAQNVNIPDANFKAALVGNAAINTNLDTEIQFTEASTFTGAINVNGYTISDLTGIEAFTSLTILDCGFNQLTSLNISVNTALTDLSCNSNQLVSLDVSANTALTSLICNDNLLTNLNISTNTALNTLYCNANQLSNLNVSTNTALTYLSCSDNLLTNLNVSANAALNHLSCGSNQLTSLNIKNGNNVNLFTFAAQLNPSLTCIQVDDATFMNASWAGAKDAGASYTTDCSSFYTVNIPDVNFKAALVADAAINTNLDGEIQYNEAASYTGAINVNNLTISDLTGIEAFTALTNLECFNNQLTSLNVSANTALTYLDFRSNQLTSLDISANTALTGLYCNTNQLTSLNLSANIALSDLDCNNNLLTSLDISANTALTYLDCGSNQLTSLNVSANTALVNLFCNNNQLTSLDVSANTALAGLNFYSNQLTSLDVSANTALTGLNCNYNQLTSLDVSANTALTNLYCSDNILKSLNVSANTTLNTLDCNTNLLTSLNVSANTALINLNCQYNQLTSLNIKNGNNINLAYFGAALNPNLSCIQVDDATFMNTNWAGVKDADASYNTDCSSFCTVNIPDANFKAALVADATINTNLDGFIQCSEAVAYTGIINVSSQGISDLTGIEAFTSLTVLDCSNNQLTSLNVSTNTALTNLYCNYNQLTALDVSTNTNLFELVCNSNELTSLNFSTNTALNYLDCSSNLLTILNISSNTTLTYLDCNTNQLNSLDLSANTALTDLDCGFNLLISLNVSTNTALTTLVCFGNLLTTIDVSANTNLTDLNCNSNQLSSLDVSANTALVTLICNSNQLTSLNVSGNSAIISLYCDNNLLTSLNLSANTALVTLICNGNQLTNIDVSANTALASLICFDNLLTNLNVSANTALLVLRCNANQLMSLNVKNGNNSNLIFINATNNPFLNCIQVDDAAFMNTNWASGKDMGASYSIACAVPVASFTSESILCVGTNLNFVNTSTEIATSNWLWAFGDGSSSTLQNPSHTYTSAATYIVTLTASNGYGNSTFTQNITVTTCTSVWPGDANDDFVANNIDVLNIGLAYGATSYSRNASSNNWQEQPSVDWPQSIAGVNYKHADCDGNGIINDDDTLAISLNYGQTHSKSDFTKSTDSDPVFSLQFVTDTLVNDDVAVVKIRLAEATTPINNFYGIAFSINYDSQYIKENSCNVSFNNTWLGTINTNLITLQKDQYLNSATHIAVTRKDHTNVSGNGEIGEFRFKTKNVITGANDLNITISNVKLIDNTGFVINVQTQGDVIVVKDKLLSVNEKSLNKNTIRIYPNPNNGIFTINASNTLHNATVKITNVSGQLISESYLDNNSTFNFDLTENANGFYFVEINQNGELQRFKLVKN